MAKYLVVEVNAAAGRVVLSDHLGRYSTARVTTELPVQGQQIHGPKAALGLSLMSDAATGQVFRLVFESVDCAAASTFGWIPR